MFKGLGKKADVPGTQSKREDVIIKAMRGSWGNTKQGLVGSFKGSFPSSSKRKWNEGLTLVIFKSLKIIEC